MLWGAFGNAATAMQAMSLDLGTIGQNVANVNTNGYKVADTQFQTQLSEQIATPASGNPIDPKMTSGSGTSIFGVGTYTRNLISVQGPDSSTGNGNDLAINGQGFFIVAPAVGNAAPATVNLSDPSAAYYTRDGSFQQQSDATGRAYFVNGAGDYLMGWMAAAGVVGKGALTPVYTQPTTTMPAVPTTLASVNANIPADTKATPGAQASTQSVTENGTQQTLSLQWTRVNATTWTVGPTAVTGGTLAPLGNPAGNTYTVTTDSSGAIAAVADAAGNSYPPTAVPFSVTWADGDVKPADQPSVDLNPLAPTITLENFDLPIDDASPATATQPGGTTHTLVLGMEKTGADTWNLSFTSPELTAQQSSTATVTDAAVPPATVSMGLSWTSAGGNTWTVMPTNVTGGDSATGSATVTIDNGVITYVNGVAGSTTNAFTVTTAGGVPNNPAVDLSTALPTFPTINAPVVAVAFDGNGKLDPSTPSTVPVSVTWGNGQKTTTTIDISQLTQFTSNGSGTVTVNSISQNGSLGGNLVQTSFDSNGVMTGTFSNGESHPLFQVPLASFVAPDSLLPVSGNMFQLTAGAGAMTVQAVDQTGGGATSLSVGSVEASTVDLGTQMTDLITAQKAYSMNSQVFQIADQMTTVARDLQT